MIKKIVSMKKNDVYALQIESLSSDGNGVGRVDGMAVFVPHTAVGDQLDARIVKVGRSHAYGIIERLTTPSPDRIGNDCPAYPKCGGCAFRHLSYEAELRAKFGIVLSTLKRIGGFDIQAGPTLHTGAQERYRNKVQYPVTALDEGLAVGFYAGRSHRVVPATDCLLQPRIVNDIAQSCCHLLAAQGVAAYNERDGSGLLRHLFMRRSDETGDILLCPVLAGDALPDEAGFVSAIRARHPEISTVLLNINKRDTNVILGTRYRALYGDGLLADRLSGVPVRLSPPSFLQVNHAAAELLYKEIARLAAPASGDVLLDLYCGVGTIGLSMAARCKQLIGVEIATGAVEDARQNAADMGIKHAEFIAADAAQAAAQLAAQGRRIDIAVTDPPRKGCDARTLAALVEMAPRRIAMVSCNPATLARDLRILADAGYSLDEVSPVDMFPRTRHVECVALLSRKM